MTGAPASGDRLRAVFGKSRRRLALYYLLSNEYTDIDTLSVQIAAWEQEESVKSVDEADRRAVKISLHHNHLPRLATENVVEYDIRSGDVVRSNGFDDLRPAIKRLRETDEQGDATKQSEDSTADERLASSS